MKKIVAKYEGHCRYCKGPIHVGESVYWEKGKGAWHLNCERSNISDKDLETHNKGYKLATIITFTGLAILFIGLLIGSDGGVFLGVISLFIIPWGLKIFYVEWARFRRWKTWYKKAIPYSESAWMMYPYNPYPDVTCWNCGQFVRRPILHWSDKYIKPVWRKIDGRWMAFCSNCNANVTKEVVEAKYGHPYVGDRFPKIYHGTTFWQMIRGKKACIHCGFELSSSAERCSKCGLNQG